MQKDDDNHKRRWIQGHRVSVWVCEWLQQLQGDPGPRVFGPAAQLCSFYWDQSASRQTGI